MYYCEYMLFIGIRKGLGESVSTTCACAPGDCVICHVMCHVICHVICHVSRAYVPQTRMDAETLPDAQQLAS